MEKIKIYDNGGKTCDRYTIIFLQRKTRYTTDGQLYEALASSDNPFHPLGFGHHVECLAPSKQSGKFLGKKIKFTDLPEQVQQFVEENL
jgi:hypothetical protein